MSLTSRSLKPSRFGSVPRQLPFQKPLEAFERKPSNVTFNLPSVKSLATTASQTPRLTPHRSRSLKFFQEGPNIDDIVGSEVLKTMNFALNPVIIYVIAI